MTTKLKKKTKKSGKSSNLFERSTFWTEFSAETDIFTDQSKFPDWIFDFREELLVKLSPTARRVCRWLKGTVDFKIKYPIEIDDKWKFADIYIPSKRTVIVFLSSHKEFANICHKTPERASFFSDRFRVVEFYEYHDFEYLKQKLELQ